MPVLNQREHAWVTAGFQIGNVYETRITELNYDDNTDSKNNWGAGSRPVSRSKGKYEATADITLYQSAVEELQLAAPGGDLAQIPMFDIIVTFAPELGQTPITHKIRGCQFLGNSRKLSASSDGGITVQLKLIVAEILWN